MLKKVKYKNKVYTVDYRLKEFRFVEYGKMLEFIPFDSELGIKLLNITGEGDYYEMWKMWFSKILY